LIESSKTAVLRIAGESSPGTNKDIDCEFHGLEAKRLRLSSAQRVSILTPVTLQYNDALFLGEVVQCTAVAPRSFDLEIKVEQILTGLQSLMVLRARLLGEGFPHTPAEAGTSVRVARRA
jgi:hypothetical protein